MTKKQTQELVKMLELLQKQAESRSRNLVRDDGIETTFEERHRHESVAGTYAFVVFVIDQIENNPNFDITRTRGFDTTKP